MLSEPTNATEDSVRLSWTRNINGDFKNYTIYALNAQGSTGDQIHAKTDKATTSYTAKNLSPDTTYHFIIRVYDNSGLYTDSNQVSGKTTPPLGKCEPEDIYNISGEEVPNIEAFKEILGLLDRPEDLITFVEDRPGHDVRYSLNSSKIRSELGWKPRYTFSSALKETVEWYVIPS